MDVRLHRASKAAALTLLIIITTALVSVWLNNPPPPISWEKDGRVSYSDITFNLENPASLNITYNADVDILQNTTRIYVEINTELIVTKGLLSFELVSSYLTHHSRYSIADSRNVILSSSSSSKYWNRTLYEDRSPYELAFFDLNKTNEQNHVFPTEYTLLMKWNSTLTLVEERDNDTVFTANLDFWIHFVEIQTRFNPSLFTFIF